MAQRNSDTCCSGARRLLDACLSDIASACPDVTGHTERAEELSAELAEIAYNTALPMRCTAGVGACLRYLKNAPGAPNTRECSSRTPSNCFQGLLDVVVAFACASVRLQSDGLGRLFATGEFPEMVCELNTIVEETDEEERLPLFASVGNNVYRRGLERDEQQRL